MIRFLLAIVLTALIQLVAPLPPLTFSSKSPLLAASTDVPSRSSPVPDAEELSTTEHQIELLEAQLQMTRNYQGSLLDTVYWALGGIFIVASLLLGFGWFVNFKVYERDKDSLRAELEATTHAKATELDRSVANQMAAVSNDISKQIERAITESLRPHVASIAGIERRIFTLKFQGLKKEMEADSSESTALTDALSLLEFCHKKAQDEVPDIIHFML